MVHKPPFRLQRYNKKCTYASKASLFLKNNRFYLLKQILCYSLEACLHKSMQRGRFIRRSRIFQNRRVPLEYVQHFANVLSRWARCKRGRCPRRYDEHERTCIRGNWLGVGCCVARSQGRCPKVRQKFLHTIRSKKHIFCKITTFDICKC